MAPAFLGLGRVIHGVRRVMNDLRRVMNQVPGVSLRLRRVTNQLPAVNLRLRRVMNELPGVNLRLPEVIHDLADVIRRVLEGRRRPPRALVLPFAASRSSRAARNPDSIAPATVPVSSLFVASPAKKSVFATGFASARWALLPPTSA